MAKPQFTPQQIVQIRAETDQGIINVRAWANAMDVSLETVRRIGRRDTYRSVDRGDGGETRRLRGLVTPSAEPSEVEVAASQARLMERLGGAAKTAQGVNATLDELMAKGGRE